MPAATETRILLLDDAELRVVGGDDEPTRIVGYAAVFDRDSEMIYGDRYGFIERIAVGAFSDALKRSDVRALKNHDPNLILGRVKAGTLTLTEDGKGLLYEATIPDTTIGRDTAEEIRRGDITGNSFAFTVRTDQWEMPDEGPDVRTIIEIDQLYDVGPVVYPAYPDTTVALRSLEAAKAEADPLRACRERVEQAKNIIRAHNARHAERLQARLADYRRRGRR